MCSSDLKELEEINVDDEKNISDYIKIKNQLLRSEKEFQAFLTNPRYILGFLNSGRLLKVSSAKVPMAYIDTFYMINRFHPTTTSTWTGAFV